MTQTTFQQGILIDALAVTSKVKEKLQPFIAQICKGNIEWTFLVFSQLYQYLSLPQTQLTFKFNSLVATKIIMDTCQFQVILIIEVYFLPLIKKIACYQINSPQKSRGIDFFMNNCYEKSTNSKKLGYNFVRLACQIVNIFSIVKPYQLYKYEEVSQASQFAALFQYMRSQGWKEYGQLAFYHQNPLKMRTLYLQKLQSSQGNLGNYQKFIRSSLQNIIKKDLLPIGLDPRKIVEFYEIQACNFTLQLLKQFALSFQAVALINVFRLISEMIRWGNIGAIYTIQSQPIFDCFIEMVEKAETESGDLGQGKNGFEKIIGTQQQKMTLYVQILKSLEIWAACIPKSFKENQKDSKSTFLFKKLAFELGIKFPILSNIKKIRNQCFENMQKHKKSNQRWFRQKLNKSQFNIPKYRRNTNQLRQLLNTHTGKMRKQVVFNESVILRQKTKESIHPLRDKNLDQSQKILEAINSPRSTIAEEKKCPFTEKFYRQKKRKGQLFDLDNVHNTYSKSHTSNFKTVNFEDQKEKRRCSVTESGSHGLMHVARPSDFGSSYSKVSSDISDQDTAYSQEVEQRITQPIIKSIQSKMRMKNYIPKEKSANEKQKSTQDEDQRQTKFKKQVSTKSKVSIYIEDDNKTEENMEFFSSLSSNSSGFGVIEPKKVHCIHIIPPNGQHQIEKNGFKKIEPKEKQNRQQCLQPNLLMSRFSKISGIQIEKLQERVVNLEQQNKNLKGELQKKEKQLANYKSNENDVFEFMKDEKNKKFSWTYYLFGDDEPVIEDSGKKLSQLNKIAALKPEQLIKKERFTNEIAQLESLGGKKLIKNKDLLLRTQNIQIGFVFQLDKDIGNVTIYITPEKDLNELKYRLTLTDNIKCNENSELVQSIPKKKQKKVSFSFRVNPPYLLPKFIVSYQLQGNKYTNTVIVPISYNKFVTFQQKTFPNLIQPLIRKKSKVQMINKKILSKREAFYQFFNCLPCKNESKQDNQLKCNVIIKSKLVEIFFYILNEDFIQIEYATAQSNQQTINFIEFFVMTLMAIIKK